jgi:hypothetical protein
MSARRKREFSCSVFGSWKPPRSSLGAMAGWWWLCDDVASVGRCREKVAEKVSWTPRSRR